jgi:NAD(P)-dependent dehydrogenase (short-subunit alcohol dehydrogenase family)
MTLTIDLTGKRVVLTGASSGIGAEIAVAVATAGGAVALVGRDHERLEATRLRVEHAGGAAVVVSADLTSESGPADVIAAAAEQLGGLTTLISAAGVFEPMPFDKGGIDVLDRALAVNVRAPYALALAAMPHLRPGGSILFISSIGGHVGFPGCAAYGASKGAVELLVKCLAVEEAPNGVRVNAIAPGNVHTPMNAAMFDDPDFTAAEIAATPLGRIGEVEDIAPAAAFLISDAASYITGASVVIDGGIVAG